MINAVLLYARRTGKPNASAFLVVHGDRDWVIPFSTGQLLYEGIPGARWHRFAGVGHNVPVDRPEEFNAQLLAFLDGR